MKARTSLSNLPPHLLATKLGVPPARGQLVARPRLFDRIEEGLRANRRVTLIAAPAGSGKTTLVSAWRATSAGGERPLGWVSLDSGDNDPLLFWSYVLAALDLAAPGAGASALATLAAPQPPLIETVLTGLLNALAELPASQSGPGLALVLEDYHVITTPEIHRALTWLIERLPDSLHLILLTRADPSLPLARLRANGDLTELHADDLRFTPDEAAAFLNQTMNLALTASEIEALDVRTEGWIAGLQLAALALKSHPNPAGFIQAFAGTNRYILDYLAAEVLDRQPLEVQTFLLRTAILDRLCGALCDAVLGPTATSGDMSGQDRLEALERANLFVVSLDDARQWYRYHHLFADVLRQRLRRSLSEDQITALHERASQWYQANGWITESIHHALAIPDGLRAAELIEQHGLGIIVAGQAQTALNWLNRLPEGLHQTRFYLNILHALALLFTNDLDGAEACLEDAERCLRPESPPAELQAMRGNVAAIRANIATYTGDLLACASYGQQVLALLPETDVIARTTARLHVTRAYRVTGDVRLECEKQVLAAVGPIRASGNRLATLGAVINVARLQELQGRLHAAEVTYRDLEPIAGGREELRGLHGAQPYFVGLGGLHYEWNDLDHAAEDLAQAEALGPRTVTTDAEYVMLGQLATARLQQARGKRDEARGTLVAYGDLARRRGFQAHLVRRAAALEARFALAGGQLEAAAAWAEASGLHADDETSFAHEFDYLTLARVWIAQAEQSGGRADLTPTLQMLDRLMSDAVQKARGSSVLEIKLVQALAGSAMGDRSAALSAFGQALALAEPEGYVRRFVDEGPVAWSLLRSASAGTGSSGYVARLLAAIEAEPFRRAGDPDPVAADARGGSSHVADLVETLTERELDVLRLIAAGHSNAQIAQALVIALSTVKSHTNTIFGKLAVASRTQAIARARELQLL